MRYLIVATKPDITILTHAIERSFVDVERAIQKISEDFERHAAEAQMGLDRINQIIIERTSQFRKDVDSLSASTAVSGNVSEPLKKVPEDHNSRSFMKQITSFVIFRVIYERMIVWWETLWQLVKENFIDGYVGSFLE